jgi:hypothetical protein
MYKYICKKSNGCFIVYKILLLRVQKNSTSPFLAWISYKAIEGLTAFIPEIDCDQTAKGLPGTSTSFLTAKAF